MSTVERSLYTKNIEDSNVSTIEWLHYTKKNIEDSNVSTIERFHYSKKIPMCPV